MTGFSTRAVQTGFTPDPLTGAVVPPLTLASTFVLKDIENSAEGYDYSRSGNPTRDAYCSALASLESGEAAKAFPSGLSAEDTLIRILTKPGDTILYGKDAYGGTGRLFTWVLPHEGRTTLRIDTTNVAEIRAALEQTKATLLWLETPSNPQLEITDIAAAVDVAHKAGARVVVDNTFATPVFTRPIELGADVVVHSTTKFIGGHSDLVGGAAIFAPNLSLGHQGLSETDSVVEEVGWWQNAVGCVPGPFDCWLAHRGLRTLNARVRAANASAQKVAEALTEFPLIETVLYPGLPGHPGHDIAARQMGGFGAIISFIVGSRETAKVVCENTSIFRLAVSLGAAESLIEFPNAMTHASLAATSDAAPANLIRLAIGLEDPEDLIEDLRQAFDKAGRA
ncbi:MAG: PLP-dependent transferase [Propionibacteriaceae bacterium]|jgi:cystathionine gamma-synthase|nr:PLP-dependent transferase [Propionibacteriaceae bacterium]